MKKVILILGVAMMVMFMINPATAQEKAKKSQEEVKIQTSAVCDMCKERIESNIAYEKGVKKVELDDSTKIVTIVFDPKKNSADGLRTAISKVGYDADNVAADPEAYAKLPACCKKDQAPH